MKAIRYLNVMLTIGVVLGVLGLWTAWTAAPPMIPAAHAQGIPDEGAQRQQIIDQLKLLNLKTDALHQLLNSGQVRVQVVMPNNDPDQTEPER